MPLPTRRPNVTNDEQEKIESAEFDSGVPHHVDKQTKIRARGLGGAERNVGGTIIPDSDKPGLFLNEEVGRSPSDPVTYVVKRANFVSFLDLGESEFAIDIAPNTGFLGLAVGQKLLVAGSASNDGLYTVDTVQNAGERVKIDETLTPEGTGALVTVTLQDS